MGRKFFLFLVFGGPSCLSFCCPFHSFLPRHQSQTPLSFPGSIYKFLLHLENHSHRLVQQSILPSCSVPPLSFFRVSSRPHPQFTKVSTMAPRPPMAPPSLNPN